MNVTLVNEKEYLCKVNNTLHDLLDKEQKLNNDLSEKQGIDIARVPPGSVILRLYHSLHQKISGLRHTTLTKLTPVWIYYYPEGRGC